ncbi:glycosyltransferase family 4 protein [Candidatus Peregrinibacteria bacterium]|nr:glycosyltransferase family 4 protein [Candidatus Peregrinibacteria bacterium]
MKIAIDIRTAGGEKAGKGWFTFHISQSLLQLDHENEYILYAKDGIPGYEQYKNATMKLMDKGGFSWHLAVARDCKKEKVDLYISPSSYITPALLPKSIKSLLIVHDLVAFFYPNTHNKKATLIEKIFLKRAIKKATKVITISQNTKRDLINKYNYEESKISIIYCAAADDFKPLKKDLLGPFIKETNLPANFFLAVGTLEPRKNYPTLISAFSLIAKKHPDYHLIIVGGEGWDFEEIYRQVKQNSLKGRVHFLGYLSTKSLVNLYNLAKALVFPSFYEGFGIPPLEAMKCGCPVITSFSSSLPEVVGDSAILIDPSSQAEIAAAMLKLIQEPDLALNLSNRGRVQARKFSWQESARKLLEIIKES